MTTHAIIRSKPAKKAAQRAAGAVHYTVANLHHEFPDDHACLEYIKEQRWPNGVTRCEKCNVRRKHYRVARRAAFACDHCGNHIYPLKGTLFAKSSTSLKTWFYVMYLMASTRCAMTAKRIQRETGVTYKTAWRMLRQIRPLIIDEQPQPGRPIMEAQSSHVVTIPRAAESEAPSHAVNRTADAGASGPGLHRAESMS